MKKGDATQVFVYAIAMIIVALILFFGFRAVKSLISTEAQISVVAFRTDLEKSVNSISSDYGSFETRSFDVPAGVDKVCFVDRDKIQKKDGSGIDDSLINDSITSGVQKNIFFIPEGEPLWFPKLKVHSGYDCAKKSGGRIRLKLTGGGSYTTLEVVE